MSIPRLTSCEICDKPKEACGIFGICGHPEAAAMTYFGLYALQHRGQESAGIAVARNEAIVSHKGMGLVPDVFDVNHLEELEGCCAIGHVRYSTTGSSILSNAQPFIVRHRNKTYAVGHNGNITNAHDLKEELEQAGSIFQSTMDSEVFLHLFVKRLKLGFEQALIESVGRLEGAFSLIMLTSRGEVVGIRDPHGFRPLCLGRLNGYHVLASESCALDLVEAQFVREIEPGEIVIITREGIRSIRTPAAPRRALCIFELIYFARPDSTIDGQSVYMVRKAQGRQLAREAPVEADFVMPFPDSGTYAAVGYSAESGIPYELGMIRNHYVGRTFIQPTQTMRDFAVRVKLNPVKELLKGKCVIALSEKLMDEDRKSAIRTVLHEVAHFYLRHMPPGLMTESGEGCDCRQEREAEAQVNEWLKAVRRAERQQRIEPQ